MRAPVFLLIVMIAMPGGIAGAQSWTQLETLSFQPVSLDSTIEARGTTNSRAAGDAESRPENEIARIAAALEAIAAEEEANGENSFALVPLLLDLSDIYVSLGDYFDAIPELNRAQLIVRRENGLYSLDQADVIERLIAIEMALTPTEQAVELEAELSDLVRRNPGDPRNVGILIDAAERQMTLARYLLVNGIPPQFDLNIDLNAGFGGGRRFYAPPTAEAMARSTLRRARVSYTLAQHEALRSDGTNIPKLLELEDSVISTYYFELMNPKLRGDSQAYRAAGQLRAGGASALYARLNNSETFNGTPEAVASAMVETGDWRLMFLGFGTAIGIYESALEYLRKNDAEEYIPTLFGNATPVPLPDFAANLNVFADQSDVYGYIDVEIEVNRFGGVRQVDVVGQSSNSSPAIERRLKRFVYQSRFRPRYIDGDWLRSDRFTQRYVFGYSRS